MTIPARKQFPNWVQKAALAVDSSSIDKYVVAIDKLLEEESIEFWLKVLKIALGFRLSSQDTNSFIESFINEDPDFPRTDNQNLVRHLACSTIALYVNESDSMTASRIALSIKTSIFLGQYNLSDVPYVVQYASLKVQKDSTSIRSYNLAEAELDIESIEEQYNDVADEEEADFRNEEMGSILNAIRTTLAVTKALKEELNVHWWLFGEYMLSIDEIFASVPVERMVFLSALELANHTVFEMPFRNSRQYLRKALNSSKTRKKLNTASLYKSVNDLTNSDKEELLGQVRDKVNYLTPVLLAITSSQDVTDEDWSSQFKALTRQGDPQKEFDLLQIADQLYHELILLKLA